MTTHGLLSRRRFLQSAGFVAAAWGLAACGASAPGPSAAASSSPSGAAARPAASTAGGSASAGAAAGRLKVASTSTAGTQTPLWLADELGAWTSRGLTVQRSQVNAEVGTKTLLAKEIDVLMQSPPAVITADLNGGVDLVYVASVFNHSQFALAVAPAIQSAADLKGKRVGNDLPGTTNDFQVQVMLAKLGLKPSDVQLLNLQSSQGIYAALLSGKIDAAPLGVPVPFQAAAKGFRLLVNTFDIKYQNIGPVVLRSRVEELRSRLVPLALGIRDGMRAFTAQPELAKTLITRNTKESDSAILQRTYDFYTKDTQFQLDLQPTLEGIQSMLDIVGDSLPAAKRAKPEQFVDTRILERLPKS